MMRPARRYRTSTVVPPHALPLGEAHPPGEKHAVSFSLPTWDSVSASSLQKRWVHDNLKSIYPRFGLHQSVQQLNSAVHARFNLPTYMHCRIFTSEKAVARCIQLLAIHDSDLPLFAVSLHLPTTLTTSSEEAKWSKFHVLIFHEEFSPCASKFWSVFGDGISSRHADFAISRIQYLESSSKNAYFCTPAPESDLSLMRSVDWTTRGVIAKQEIKSRIANLISTDHEGFRPVLPRDVFLYPKGMCAITAVVRGLVPEKEEESEAVIYGHPYSDTPKCISNSGYARFTLYGHGSTTELDSLEASLISGRRIRLLFCEIPSNPLIQTPDLHRIRKLADRFGFVVVCDETLGTFVNVDVLPWVDVVVTSLTKVFSGGSNVMGGSVVVNPSSRHYKSIHGILSSSYEDLLFPLDAITLATNSKDFTSRIRRCNNTALTLTSLLQSHPSIKRIYYPTLNPSLPLYERYRRETGGYGFLFSFTFRNPSSAVIFYETLDVCKGPSVGANFTLALPYAQLAHVRDLDVAEGYGVERNMVRVSVGLEEEWELSERIGRALREVEEYEMRTEEFPALHASL